MTVLSQMAARVCFACVTAAAVRLIFPNSNLKAVINTVMVLYILSAALELPEAGNRPLRLTVTAAQPAKAEELTAVGDAWYLEAVAQELGRAAGLEGRITITEKGVCLAEVSARDFPAAEKSLRDAGWQGQILQEADQ